jgi:hypothetical protein
MLSNHRSPRPIRLFVIRFRNVTMVNWSTGQFVLDTCADPRVSTNIQRTQRELLSTKLAHRVLVDTVVPPLDLDFHPAVQPIRVNVSLRARTPTRGHERVVCRGVVRERARLGELFRPPGQEQAIRTFRVPQHTRHIASSSGAMRSSNGCDRSGSAFIS